MGLDPEQLQPFQGTLAGFTGEQVHVRGYITLKTTFGSGSNAKTIRVRYLVINSPSSYNIIIGRPSFNLLGAFLSTKFLVMKYPLNDGKVGTIRGDKKIARECYHNSLRLQKAKKKPNNKINHEVNMIDLDPREDFQQRTPGAHRRLKGNLYWAGNSSYHEDRYVPKPWRRNRPDKLAAKESGSLCLEPI
jgi:hypothetical protein